MKRLGSAIGILVVNILVLELALSVIFFQQYSDHYSALSYYTGTVLKAVQSNFRSTGIGIWEDDAVKGYAHKSDVKGVHSTSEFDVVYTINDKRSRLMPFPVGQANKRMVFLGASFTFGWGVSDSSTYPYLLAKERLKNWKLENRAVSGWGTAHAYLELKDLLTEGEKPAVVVYAMIPDHIQRNYVRASWLDSLHKSNRRHPYFEIDGEELKYISTVGLEHASYDIEHVRKRELDITSALLTRMSNMSQNSESIFVVILLPQKYGLAGGRTDWPPAIVETLIKQNIRFIDLSEMTETVEYFPIEVHPTEAGHRVLANAIAEPLSEIIEYELRANERTSIP